MEKEKEAIEYAENQVRLKNEYPNCSMYRQKTLTRFDAFDIQQAFEDGWDKASEEKASTELTTEILEKSGFTNSKVLNLSPDYCIDSPEFTVSINLQDSCDTSKGIWVTRKSDKACIDLVLDRRRKDKLYVEQLQGLLDLLGLNLKIKY